MLKAEADIQKIVIWILVIALLTVLLIFTFQQLGTNGELTGNVNSTISGINDMWQS